MELGACSGVALGSGLAIGRLADTRQHMSRKKIGEI